MQEPSGISGFSPKTRAESVHGPGRLRFQAPTCRPAGPASRLPICRDVARTTLSPPTTCWKTNASRPLAPSRFFQASNRDSPLSDGRQKLKMCAVVLRGAVARDIMPPNTRHSGEVLWCATPGVCLGLFLPGLKLSKRPGSAVFLPGKSPGASPQQLSSVAAWR